MLRRTTRAAGMRAIQAISNMAPLTRGHREPRKRKRATGPRGPRPALPTGNPPQAGNPGPADQTTAAPPTQPAPQPPVDPADESDDPPHVPSPDDEPPQDLPQPSDSPPASPPLPPAGIPPLINPGWVPGWTIGNHSTRPPSPQHSPHTSVGQIPGPSTLQNNIPPTTLPGPLATYPPGNPGLLFAPFGPFRLTAGPTGQDLTGGPLSLIPPTAPPTSLGSLGNVLTAPGNSIGFEDDDEEQQGGPLGGPPSWQDGGDDDGDNGANNDDDNDNGAVPAEPGRLTGPSTALDDAIANGTAPVLSWWEDTADGPVLREVYLQPGAGPSSPSNADDDDEMDYP